MGIREAIVLGLALECVITLLTAHRPGSPDLWEIGPAFFGGNIDSYIFARLFHWIPAATFVAAVCYRAVEEKRGVVALFFVGLLIEVATTLLSSLLKEPEPSYGIYFRSAWTYALSRLVFWSALVGGLALIANRRKGII
jgi:hypothetical protein